MILSKRTTEPRGSTKQAYLVPTLGFTFGVRCNEGEHGELLGSSKAPEHYATVSECEYVLLRRSEGDSEGGSEGEGESEGGGEGEGESEGGSEGDSEDGHGHEGRAPGQ